MIDDRSGRSLPAPPYGKEVDLTRFAKMPLDVTRLVDSRFTATVEPEAWKVAVLLWAKSWHQIPAGSLPGDESHLAHLAGYSGRARAWKRVREGGALYGWTLHEDGRLYHPVVAEMVLEAWNYAGKKAAAGSKGGRAKAEKARIRGDQGATESEHFPESFGQVSTKFEKVSPEFVGNSPETQTQSAMKSRAGGWHCSSKERNGIEHIKPPPFEPDATREIPAEARLSEPSPPPEPAASAAGGGRLADDQEIAFGLSVADALGADPVKLWKWNKAGMEAPNWRRSGFTDAQILAFARAEGAKRKGRLDPPSGPEWLTVALMNAAKSPPAVAALKAAVKPKASLEERAAVARRLAETQAAEAAERARRHAEALARIAAQQAASGSPH